MQKVSRPRPAHRVRFFNMYENSSIWISNRAEQSLQAARSALMRAQKDTQEAFMRYTSYREIEQQARLAVTNAEKRRDDISEQWRPYSWSHLLISYSGYYSSPKSDTHGFVNTLFSSRDNRTTFSLQMLNQESHQYQETIDAVLQGILWRYVVLNYFLEWES